MWNTSSPAIIMDVDVDASIIMEDSIPSHDVMITNNQNTGLRKARFCGILNPCLNLSYSYCVDGRRGPICDCIQGYTKNELNECEGWFRQLKCTIGYNVILANII